MLSSRGVSTRRFTGLAPRLPPTPAALYAALTSGLTPALAALIATLAAPQPATLSAQAPTPVPGEVTCADCIITLDTIATIGGWEDAGLHVITPFSQVAVDRRGRILVTHLSYPEISVFSPEGDYVGTVGRGGTADGEYEAIAHVNVGGRYIHVFEFQRGRTVLDHDFEVVRTDRSIPQVLSSVVTDTDEVAFALHVPGATGIAHQRLVLDMVGRTVSFGGAEPVRRGPQMQRFVVAGDEDTFWAVRQQANRIVGWDLGPEPAVTRVFDRTIDAFERDNPTDQSWPRSLNVGAMLDDNGLWIAWQTPDAQWTERISPGDPIPEVPWQTVLDGWLDLVDPSTGRTIARYQGDDALLGFAHGSRYVVSYHEPRVGGAYIHLLAPNITRADRPGRRGAATRTDRTRSARAGRSTVPATRPPTSAGHS